MKTLLIVSFAPIVKKNNVYYSYAPYVKEIELWCNEFDKVLFCSPIESLNKNLLLQPFQKFDFDIISVPLISTKDIYTRPFLLIKICFKIFFAMRLADHIHLRCPGNMGLLGSIAQIFFPKKKKTAKYAGNWDWNSNQPWLYRLQQFILRNTFISRNMKVLVYGNWNETNNIIPFFTASYSNKEIIPLFPRKIVFNQKIRLIYVGGLKKGKRPLLSLTVSKNLHDLGINNEIHFWGDGDQFSILNEYIATNGMVDYAFLHGNVDSKTVKLEYQNSHFLIFISESEGWPKVVAESMFWGCLPLTTKVSCVEEMLGFGQRGDIVEPSVTEIVNRILFYLNNSSLYELKCKNAMEWSRIYTLEKFESEIKKLLRN